MANSNDSAVLRFVEVEASTAYIDSRVYCAQIIKVNHSDWLHNVVRKHQLVIESRFWPSPF